MELRKQQAELEKKMLSLKFELEVEQTRFSGPEKTDFDESDVMHGINTASTRHEEYADVSASSLRKPSRTKKAVFLYIGFDPPSTYSTRRSIRFNPPQHIKGEKSIGILKGCLMKLRIYPHLS